MDSGAFFVQRSAVTVLSPRYFVAGVSSFLTKIPPVFRTGNQAASGTDLPFWNYSVRKYEISGSHWVVQRIRRCLLGLREVRDENKIFVTRAWRRFCWMISTHMLLPQFLDENRRCFRSGGQRGCGSELACGTCFASRLLLFSTPYPFVGFLNDRRLGR